MLNKNLLFNLLILLSGFTPILMFVNNNLSYLTSKDIYEIIIIFLIIIFISLLLVLFLFSIKINDKDLFFFISLNIFLLFLWSDLKIIIENLFLSKSQGAYYYFLIIILNIIFFIFKKFNLMNFFKFLLISLLIINFLLILNKSLFNNSHNSNIIDKNLIIKNNYNVYILVVDGYGGSEYLKSSLNFDNKNLIDFLLSRNFLINEKTFSNYSTSGLSIHSLLDTEYVHYKNKVFLSDHYPELFKKKLPKLISLAKNNGYDFYSGSWEGCYNILEDYCINDKKKIGKIIKNIYLMTPFNDHMHHISAKANKKLKDMFIKKLYVKYDTLKNFNNDFSKFQINKNKKFVFLHNLAPHAPYEFNSDCSKKKNFLNHISTTLNDETYPIEVQKELYLENLKCTNKYLIEVINKIVNSDKESIILLASDHGARLGNNYILENYNNAFDYNKISNEQFLSIFNNISMIYLPNKCKKYNKNVVSLVNQSRIILSCLLDKNIENLEDKFHLIIGNEKLFQLSREFINIEN